MSCKRFNHSYVYCIPFISAESHYTRYYITLRNGLLVSLFSPQNVEINIKKKKSNFTVLKDYLVNSLSLSVTYSY